MQESLQTARLAFYGLLTACAVMILLGLAPGRTARHDAALAEIGELRRYVFPLADPTSPSLLDPRRVPVPDCGRALLASPVWEVLGLEPSAGTAWHPHARLADRSSPSVEWPAREVRSALQRNVGGACVLPDVADARQVMARLRARCAGCAPELAAAGDTLLVRWRDRAGALDTVAAVATRDRPQAGYGIDEALRRAGKRSLVFSTAMAWFPALDTLPLQEAVPELERLRAEASRSVTVAGLTMNERTALFGGPLVVVFLVLSLAVQIGHITRIHRVTDPALVETFPWMLLTRDPVEEVVWRLLVIVLPATAVALVVGSVLHPDPDRLWVYPAALVAAVLPVLGSSFVVARRLDALNAARARYRKIATPLPAY